MSTEALQTAIEERFRAIIDDLDTIPTAYENGPVVDLDVDGPPENQGFGLSREVKWIDSRPIAGLRSHATTPSNLVVRVFSNTGVGKGPAKAHACAIVQTMYDDQIANAILGAHFQEGWTETIGTVEHVTDGPRFQVNAIFAFLFQEILTT